MSDFSRGGVLARFFSGLCEYVFEGRLGLADPPVIDYLNQLESVHLFLANVTSLVDASVSEYQRRGFESLMV